MICGARTDNVALETWIEHLSIFGGATGAVNAVEVMKRELRGRQDEERHKALFLTRVAALGSVIAAIVGIVGLAVVLIKR